MDNADNLAEQQDEKYEQLRAEGKSKLEAAAEAAPPETTEDHAKAAQAEE